MTHRRNRSLRVVEGASERAGRMFRTFLALVALIGGILAAPVLSVAEVDKWVDENGVTHYTSDPEAIPRHLRGR